MTGTPALAPAPAADWRHESLFGIHIPEPLFGTSAPYSADSAAPVTPPRTLLSPELIKRASRLALEARYAR